MIQLIDVCVTDPAAADGEVGEFGVVDAFGEDGVVSAVGEAGVVIADIPAVLIDAVVTIQLMSNVVDVVCDQYCFCCVASVPC